MKYTEFWYNIANALIESTGDEDILGKISLEEIDNTAFGIYNSLIRRKFHPNQVRKYASEYGEHIGRGIIAYQRISEEIVSAA